LRGVSGLAKELKTQGFVRGEFMELEKEEMNILGMEKEKLEEEKVKDQKFSRVMVSLHTKTILERLAHSVNCGFHGGNVGPKEIVEWLVEKSKAGFSKQEIKDIRAAYTDEKLILETILAGAAKAIREYSGLPPKKLYQRGYEEKERQVFETRLKSLIGEKESNEAV